VFDGQNPQPRFGHTMTMISDTKAILFGGAIGNTGKFSITGDTYLCDLETMTWKKLTRTPLLN
jgi:protein phosphatase